MSQTPNKDSTDLLKKITHILTSKTFFFLIPVIGFLYSYFYEKGFNTVYRIPVFLVELDIKKSFFPITIAVLLFYVIFHFIFKLSLPESMDTAARYFNVAVLLNILLILFFRTLHFFNISARIKNLQDYLPEKFLLIEDKVYGIACILIVVYCIYSHGKRKIKSKEKFLIKQFILIFLLSALLIRSVGIFYASEARFYFTFRHPKTQNELVVLKKTGNIFVCAPFSRKDRIVLRNFHFLNINQYSEIEFRTERIGPLLSVSKKTPGFPEPQER